MNKAIFLDKDGTLIHDIPYNVDVTKIRLMEGVDECLSALKKKYQFIIVSNQSGVARGYFSEAELEVVFSHINKLLAPDIHIADFYYCKHSGEGCDCRKPLPGLLLRASADHHINLSESWMIGDILNDVEAGCRAGCKTILLDNGNETLWEEGPCRQPDFVCKTWKEISNVILNHEEP